MIPKDAVQLVTAWCAARDVGDDYRVEVERGRGSLTIVERRPVWNDPNAEWTATPIARLRHAASSDRWSLAWHRSNGRWQAYEGPTTDRLEELLVEVDRDPDGVFWG